MTNRSVAYFFPLIAVSICFSPAVAATSLTCEKGTANVCDAWCGHAGGGMSSNPDGSVTCTVTAEAAVKAFTTPMKPESLTKLKGNYSD